MISIWLCGDNIDNYDHTKVGIEQSLPYAHTASSDTTNNGDKCKNNKKKK